VLVKNTSKIFPKTYEKDSLQLFTVISGGLPEMSQIFAANFVSSYCRIVSAVLTS